MSAPILIVDDNPLNAKLVSVLLASAGHSVVIAGDAVAALAAIENQRFRLILMDIQLPGIDGLTLTTRLKAAPATSDIPIIVLTAFAMKSDEARAREAGCDGYLSKPIDTRTFVKTIAGFLKD